MKFFLYLYKNIRALNSSKEVSKMDRKGIKKKARNNIKNVYLKSVLIMFIFTVVISGGYTFTSVVFNNNSSLIPAKNEIKDTAVNYIEKKTNTDIINETTDAFNEINHIDKHIDKEKQEEARGFLAPIVNNFTRSQSVIIHFYNATKLIFFDREKAGFNVLLVAIISLLIFIFLKALLEVGKNRFYLESRVYKKTAIDKILFPYRTKKMRNLAFVLFCKNLFLSLWNYTIIGGIIKHYEYKMIPYILAENPNVTRKEAFSISKEMTKGLKWEMFKIDASLLGWYVLSIGTFGFSDLFYFSSYKEFINTEIYMNIRNKRKKKLEFGTLLNDKYLDVKEKNSEYPEEKFPSSLWKINFKRDYNQKYSIINYILFFFSFSFVGWAYEVFLHIVLEGRFVNRGTMFGPWLPIYGTGVLMILIILKPLRKKPVTFFLVAMALAGALEYTTSWLLETFAHMKWWDYTNYFLNINGRVCLEGLLVFGLGGAAITYLIAPICNSLYNRIKPTLAVFICSILIILFGCDMSYSAFHPNTGDGITSYD